MKSGSDNVFARWSRRKHAVRSGGSDMPDAQEWVAGPQEEPRAIEPADRQPAAKEPGEDEDSEQPLPRLEDLTAESDLSAFLREGVPKALKSAAMRKMWSLDPAIRDYVGPSEYAWDFNQPGSMAGFGPLESKSAAVRYLSTMSRNALQDQVAAGEPGGMEGSEDRPSSTVNAEPDLEVDTAGQEPMDEAGAAPKAVADADAHVHPDAPAEPDASASDPLAVAGERFEVARSSRARPVQASPRHGRALPR